MLDVYSRESSVAMAKPSKAQYHLSIFMLEKEI